MAIAYNPNIPQPTDQISVSQGQLLLNFGSISTYLNINHAPFADPNAGKHVFVEFPIQSPAPSTTAAEVGLFSATSTYTLEPELLFCKQSGSSAPIPLKVPYEFTSAGYATVGWTRLPSGILLKWGNSSATGGSTYNFPVAVTIPEFQAVYSAYVIASSGLGNTDQNQVAILNQFSVTSLFVYGGTRTVALTPIAVSYQYLVIGV